MDDELLDLVDANDQVIGTINRMEYKTLLAENLGYIRAVDLFILNSNGQIFVPIRTAHKTIAPNGFDYSVGGHVAAGEDYVSTLIREAEEELSLDVSSDQLEFLTKEVHEDAKYIQSLFLLRNDVTPQLNPDDFVSAEWLHPDELIIKIDQGHLAKGKLRQSVLILKDFISQNNL